jgi:hypothetical protein
MSANDRIKTKLEPKLNSQYFITAIKVILYSPVLKILSSYVSPVFKVINLILKHKNSSFIYSFSHFVQEKYLFVQYSAYC